MSPEHAAAVSNTTRHIADALEHHGVSDPHDAAERLVRWMQGRGWRVHPELSDGPAPAPRRAPAAVQKARVAEIRAALDEKRGNRPEQEVQQ